MAAAVPLVSEYVENWLSEVSLIAESFHIEAIDQLINALQITKRAGGRLFVLGVGGSAATAAHAVNDFRRIADMEAYCPTSDFAEVTAIANDVGWDWIFVEWLKESRLSQKDAILILSVNGGLEVPPTSVNLIHAIELAKEVDAFTLAIVGRMSGYAAKHADVWVRVPCPNDDRRTPHSESFQLVLTHLVAWAVRDKINASVLFRPSGEPILK